MLKAMQQNGSPPPVFETDEDRTFFLVRLPLHPQFIKEAEGRRRQSAAGQVTGQVAVRVFQFCEQPRKAGEIQKRLDVKHRQTFRENYLTVFLDKGWLARTIPDKPQSRPQRYQTTQESKRWLRRRRRRGPHVRRTATRSSSSHALAKLNGGCYQGWQSTVKVLC